ncbi:MAG TPA: CDP-diacylglycerol--glycerol-3-phosphate 3-phosphatidyltransferase [Clostridiaceae bacterium]|nr:CDP-diacylglycerol--glycerol-3-phosphate 3-phosphatidyltransferase [Clostridiaceae bacterium]
MNLPNRLTILRMILVPFVILFMIPINGWTFWNEFVASQTAHIIALILFCIASLTDFLDGYISRKYNLVTNMGKFLDPIADKLLVISTFTALVQLNRIHSFVVVIVLARELVVTGLRLLAVEQGKVIAASVWGKAKTTTQIIAIIWLMLEPIIYMANPLIAASHTLQIIGDILVLLSVILTLISGLDYLFKNIEILRKA